MPAFLTRHFQRCHYMQRKLVFRLYLYSTLSAALTSVVLYQLVRLHASYASVISVFGIGTALGLVVGRTANITWQEEQQRVTATLDTLGKVILSGYLLISLLRWWVLCQWFSGPTLTATAIGFTGGMMLGRLLYTRQVVGSLLRAQQRY